MPDPTVAVVCADPLTRSGLASLVRATGLRVVATASTLADAPDGDVVVAVDPDLADADRPVVVLVSDDTDGADAQRHGAAGILARDASEDALLAAVRAVCVGLHVVDPEVVPAAADAIRDEPPPPLTPREREVLELLAEGLSNKDIATALGVSPHTAKFHIGALLDKLDAQTRTEAVVRAVRLGLLLL